MSTELLEALLCSKLTGVQLRIVLWVIRNTYGWNRKLTPFTWYGMAKDLALNRGSVHRAGKTLLQTNLLVFQDGHLGVQKDYDLWDNRVKPSTDATRQLWMPGMSVAWEKRQALSGGNATVAVSQPKRCRDATLLRRAKDTKDRLKTYKDRRKQGDAPPHTTSPDYVERRLLAGAAKPIPGKYDSLSQD